MPQELGPNPIENPKFLFGCNNIFRKSAVLAAGGDDEAMRTNGEDADLCRKLRDRGWKLFYDPRARATDLRRDTIRSILDACWRWLLFGSRWYPNGMSLRSVAGYALKITYQIFRPTRAQRPARPPLRIARHRLPHAPPFSLSRIPTLETLAYQSCRVTKPHSTHSGPVKFPKKHASVDVGAIGNEGVQERSRQRLVAVRGKIRSPRKVNAYAPP